MALTTAIEPFEQNFRDVLEKAVQTSGVAVKAIVIVVAVQLGVQLSEQVSQLHIPFPPAPFRKVLHGLAQLLGRSAAFEMGFAPSVFAPPKLEAQEGEADLRLPPPDTRTRPQHHPRSVSGRLPLCSWSDHVYPFFQHSHEPVVVDGVEVTPDVRFYDEVVASKLQLDGQFVDCVRSVLFDVAPTLLQKLLVQQRRQIAKAILWLCGGLLRYAF